VKAEGDWNVLPTQCVVRLFGMGRCAILISFRDPKSRCWISCDVGNTSCLLKEMRKFFVCHCV